MTTRIMLNMGLIEENTSFPLPMEHVIARCTTNGFPKVKYRKKEVSRSGLEFYAKLMLIRPSLTM
jgi:hypothetical protein